jgi:hypothetical protein
MCVPPSTFARKRNKERLRLRREKKKLAESSLMPVQASLRSMPPGIGHGLALSEAHDRARRLTRTPYAELL